MALNLKLQMRLGQQLIMTPQLQQAIKLLQLSRNELEELIDQALIENPVLEEGEEGDGEKEKDGKEELTAKTEAEQDSAESVMENDHPERDLDWQEYIASGSGVIPETSTRHDGEETSLEATISTPDTLQEHILWQFEMASLTPIEMEIGEQIIGNLDDDGYLTISIAELLELYPELQIAIEKAIKSQSLSLPLVEGVSEDNFHLKHISAKPTQNSKKKKAPPDFEENIEAPQPKQPFKLDPKAGFVVEGVLQFLQTFDPGGVGARTLNECLTIQLNNLYNGDDLPLRIVRDDLKLLENKDLRKIARRQKADLDRVVEAYKLIVSLEPKPGRPFVSDRSQTILPDVFIYKLTGEQPESESRVGQYRVVLNEYGIPRLRISQFYRTLGESKENKDGSMTQEYIQEKIKAGNWLLKSIEQRQKTIFRVTRSILKHQYEFFEKGIHYLKPLVLKDVAEDIEVHESTVSRITTNKYVHTPQGIFELKYFFTSGIDQGDGDSISSKKIKDMIQKIIVGENEKEPFTDIQIAEILAKDSNIKVARRTVAKYREALNLLPSNKRRQLF